MAKLRINNSLSINCGHRNVSDSQESLEVNSHTDLWLKPNLKKGCGELTIKNNSITNF